MTPEEEKYHRLIRYNKIMIALVAVICVIITGYVFIQMKAIIIPLVLALMIYFLLNPALNFSDKKNIPESLTILVIILLTIVFSIVQFDNFITVIWIAIVLLAIQIIIGNVVESKVVEKGMGISLVVVLFSMIFWGFVWGILGMVLAVPIAVFIKIVLENINELKPLSVLLSDYKG